MPISPFLELDEERRKRDQAFQQQLSNVGSSLVSAPLTYDKLMKDAEDRKLKLDRDRVKLQQDREEHELNQTTGKLRNEETELGLTNTKQGMTIASEDEKRRAAKAAREKKDTAINAAVGAGLSDAMQFEGTDQALPEEEIRRRASALAVDNPDLQDVNPDELNAAMYEALAKRKQQGLENDLKKQALDIRKQDANTRQNRALNRLRNASVKDKDLPVPILNKIITIRQDRAAVAEIMERKKKVDTGIVSQLGASVRRMLKVPEQDRAVFDQQIQGLLNQVIKNESGATVTSQELSRQLAAFPDRWNDDDIFDATLDAYAQALEDKETATLDFMGSMRNYSRAVDDIQVGKKPTPAEQRAEPKETKTSTKKETRREMYERLRGEGKSHEQAMAAARGGK
jgi:hypothetical protein